MGIPSVLAVVLAIWLTGGFPIEGVRKIPIPGAEEGSKRRYSEVIDSQKELDALLKEVGPPEDVAGTNLEPVLKALAGARVDFTKEALVLIRNTEGGGPVDVHFWLAEGRDGTLTVMIFRHVPDGDIMLLEKYYCWAFAVRRDRVKQIKVWRQEDSLEIWQR